MRDTEYAAYSWSSIGRADDYVEGIVRTPHGSVECFSGSGHTSLQFTSGGRTYTRSFNAGYSPRYLVTLAKRFAAEKAGVQLTRDEAEKIYKALAGRIGGDRVAAAELLRGKLWKSER